MASSDEHGDRRWKALALCLAAVFMTLLDVSIVNVVLPSVPGRFTRAGSGFAVVGCQPLMMGFELADHRFSDGPAQSVDFAPQSRLDPFHGGTALFDQQIAVMAADSKP